ncbi:unnamed protein product [Urochloa decumbens]|uniref:DYW domain-containing protein n=1 Tax=Urochloa decumbens TaxID=240449 RepID=A0ABC8X3B0_9POAL
MKQPARANTAPTYATTCLSYYAGSGVRGGPFRDARRLFEEIPAARRNVFTWNTLLSIGILDRHGRGATFLDMVGKGLTPTQFTLTNVLSSCAATEASGIGRKVHSSFVVKLGLSSYVPVANSVLNMYGKFGDAETPKAVFQRMPMHSLSSWNSMVSLYDRQGAMDLAVSMFENMEERRSIVPWNAVIAGYNQNGLDRTALKFFSRMLSSDSSMEPDVFTATSVLSSCANLRTLKMGKQMHSYILRVGMPYSGQSQMTNALISMYAKSGSVETARKIMDQAVISDLNVISFTALLEGYMRNEHGITPEMSHYACMVDLLARAGLLTEAQEFIQRMPVAPDAIVWGSLLSACRVQKNADLAELAAEKLLSIDPDNGGAYSTLANVYSTCGRWNDAARIWKLRKDKAVKKETGFSWTHLHSKVHVFGADDVLHPRRDAIYKKADEMWEEIKKAGFVPDLNSVLHDVDDELKEELLSRHSEKLAIAFSLISTPEKTTLRIMKNLRVCNDCHMANKFMSKVVEREIIVRDATRFHHLKPLSRVEYLNVRKKYSLFFLVHMLPDD